MAEGGFINRYKSGFSRANDKVLVWLFLLLTGFAFGELVITPLLVTVLYIADVNLNALAKYNFSPLYIVLVFALGIVLKEQMSAFIFISLLYVIDILFNTAMRFFIRPIYKAAPLGLELVLFNTVIVGYAFGPIAGVITGLLFGSTYYGIIFGFSSQYQFINIPAYAIVGYLSGILAGGSVFSLGMALAVSYAVVTSTLIYFLLGGKPYKSLIFITTNLLFNYWLFSSISGWMLGVIA